MPTTPPSPASVEPVAAPAVELIGLTVGYGDFVVLSRVNLALPANTLIGLVGPPGGGKSTLLHCLQGRLAPRAGETRLFGQRGAAARRLAGYAPPEELIDWSFPLSLAEAVQLGRQRLLGWLRRPAARDRAAVEAALAEVGLLPLAGRRVGTLGHAERRLALLARALAAEPRLLLLDGLLDGLEGSGLDRLLELLARQRERGRTVLLATRELTLAAERCERIALLNGQLVAEGSPAEVLTEANLEAAYGGQAVPARVQAGFFAVDARAARN